MKQLNYFSRGICLFSLTGLFLASCMPDYYPPDPPVIVDQSRQKENVYYVPAAPNVPMLTEKGDLLVDAMLSTGSNLSGTELQAAFLPTKHLGISLSYSWGHREGTDISHVMDYTRFELGAGYVMKIDKNFHFETYGGLGAGSIDNFHYTGTSQVKLNHFFLQPTIAVGNEHKTVQLGFSSKFSGVHFNVVDTLFNTYREPFSADQLGKLYAQPFHVMWEPAITFRAGWKKFQFIAQYTHSADLTDPDLQRGKSNFSIGICGKFNALEK